MKKLLKTFQRCSMSVTRIYSMLAITSNKNILLANLLVMLQTQTRINKTTGDKFSPIRESRKIYIKLLRVSTMVNPS